MNRSFSSRIGYFLARSAFQELRTRMDPRRVNGGVFLGLNGLVIKSHGGTDAEGFAAAIELGHGVVQDELLAKIKELIADSPVRPHLGKAEKAPLWIPRKDTDYIVVTCPECLRSSTLPDSNATGHLQETDCIACGAKIRYLVDSSILKLLDEKKNRLPAI